MADCDGVGLEEVVSEVEPEGVTEPLGVAETDGVPLALCVTERLGVSLEVGDGVREMLGDEVVLAEPLPLPVARWVRLRVMLCDCV